MLYKFHAMCVQPLAIVCILLLTQIGPNPQGVPVAPNIDPFAPPPNFGPPPNYGPPRNYGPPPNVGPHPNYGPPPNIGPPPNFPPPPNFRPPPPNFGPPPNSNANFGFGTFDLSQPRGAAIPIGPPLPQPLPVVHPVASTADLAQPIPPEAQNAASGYASSQGTIEHEFEATGSAGGPHEPAYSNGASGTYYGPQEKTLLDAYYDRNPGAARSNNDIFGGMFGGTMGGNLAGAYFMKEYVF